MKKCKKSLFSRIYKAYAFKEGKDYMIVHEDENKVWLVNEAGDRHSFSKDKENEEYHHIHHIGDHFH